MSSKTRKTYTKVFKDKAVSQVADGEQRVSNVAKAINVGPAILSRWIKEYKLLGSD